MPQIWKGMGLLFSVLIGTSVAAHADLINVTRIADTSVYSTFGATNINNAGTVVFSNQSGANAGVYSGNGGALTTIANGSSKDSSGFNLKNFRDATINDFGTAAFSSEIDLGGSYGAGVYRGNGGAVTTIASSTGPYQDFGNFVDINNSGTVAFRTTLDAGGTALYVGNGSTATQLLNSNDPVYRGFGDPDINDAGQIAYRGALDPNVTGPINVYRLEGSTPSSTQTVISSATQTPAVLAQVYQNNAGQVLFASNTKLYLGNGSAAPTVLADNSGAFVAFTDFGLSLNNNGNYAFVSQLRDGSTAIFNGPDSVANRLIGTGDAFDGSTISGVAFYGGHSLNDSNQIAFAALLADGRQGIYRATIMATPEPSTWALMICGMGILCVVVRRRRNECSAEPIL